jgi:regulation of enolase protein 1 (concanavalin A-like superfamily)
MMRGGGADVWGTADAFHLVYQEIAGDVTFRARVASVAGGQAWTKVGLMIRESLSANAAHHFLLASVGKGLAYQRRLASGQSSLHTSIGEGGAPVVFRIVRVGRSVTLQMAPDETTPFVTVGTADFPPGPAFVGFVTSSHDTTQLATATFDGLQILGGADQPLWTNHDIGAVGAPGSAREQSGRWTVSGSGADVWGSADALHFVRQRVEGDFEFSARVLAVQNVHQWTKAGLMVREHLGASARHGFVLATPRTTKGIAFQRRPIENQDSLSTAGPAIVPPVYLKLVRVGDVVSAYYRRSASNPWTLIDQQAYFNLSFALDVGFAVSSHVDGRLASATFDQVSLSARRTFYSYDVGNVALPGRTGPDPLNLELQASGRDIWDTHDAFRFYNTHLAGNGTVVTRVQSVEPVHRWTKAGIMMREGSFTSSNDFAPYVMVMVTPGKGVAMQYRAMNLQSAVQVAAVPGAAPAWIQLRRDGDTFTGLISNDGASWTEIGSVNVPFGGIALRVGLALTSHDNSKLATATFDNLRIDDLVR